MRIVGIDPELDVDVRVSLALVGLDDFLAPVFELLFGQRPVDFQVDQFPELFGTYPLRSLDLNFIHERTRLEDHHDLDPLAVGLAEDPDVLDSPCLVECLDVLLDHGLGIWLPGFGADLGQDFIARDRLWPDVLNLYGADNRGPLIRRGLPVAG